MTDWQIADIIVKTDNLLRENIKIEGHTISVIVGKYLGCPFFRDDKNKLSIYVRIDIEPDNEFLKYKNEFFSGMSDTDFIKWIIKVYNNLSLGQINTP